MILIDYPYASDLLVNTAGRIQKPVVLTESAQSLITNKETAFTIDQEEAIAQLKNETEPKLYCNSENSIAWMQKNLSHTHLPKLIGLCKDKFAFRKMLAPVYPDFRYDEVQFNELDQFNAEAFGFPFIIKPTVGFFSLGIYVIENQNDWNEALAKLKVEMEEVKGIFPEEVMDRNRFLIEQLIPGTEYAVDAFFKTNGEPEIVNIYEHVFSSGKDVSDRLYFTSKKVFDASYDKFIKVLKDISKYGDFKNFAMHIEFRITPEGEAIPIEANPMRFAGFCMGDMTNYAWGFNPYEAYFNETSPNWNEIFKGKEDKQYNVIIASHQYPQKEIAKVNYEAFKADFSNLLHLHEIDYKKYPVFAFAFSEVSPENSEETEYFLKSNLKKYIEFQSAEVAE